MEQLTVEQIRAQLRVADEQEFSVLERSLAADTRKGVRSALDSARARLDAIAAEDNRLRSLYETQQEIMASKRASVAVGLDEVGRGPMAGPLAVGAVVLSSGNRIEGLNDSKQLSESARERIAKEIKDTAIAWSVQFIDASQIDKCGISTALKTAFHRAIVSIEEQGVIPDIVLLDGNPLHLDAREVNIVKGDSKIAAIAAASVIAKVERDSLMNELDKKFPGYGFAENKGYGTATHRQAIRELGLSPIHRVSFCGEFTQASLF
ncbi:ribonuclease HII [Adlercreutzia sp. ZJ154]|uniref:ribonuclease HII n=1 Tax=Adlercreutzia sp. ZJ154 TaxID=2709790 RepID=UPI0013EBE603|nr:ribonuclease HII [Adlercreutzia sp. ZJ154]